MKTLSVRRRLRGAALAAALGLLLPGALRAQEVEARPGEQVVGRNAELKQAFARVGQAASKFVLTVSVEGRSRGFAVLLGEGLALTADEVVDGAGRCKLSGPAGTFDATVRGRDRDAGFALLTLGGAAPAGIALGASKDLGIGQFVVVVGVEPAPIAVGVVSAKPRKVDASEHEQNILMALVSDGNEGHKRALTSVLHHDGPTEPGQFGAPVVDGEGRLVGVSVASPYRGTSHAVDVDAIVARLPALKAKAPEDPAAPPAAPAPAAARGWLGVSLVEVGPEKTGAGQGLAVRDAQGPAAAAGLKKDDVIVAIDGQPVTSMDAFAGSIGQRRPGDRVTLRVLGGGAAKDVEVILGTRPPR